MTTSEHVEIAKAVLNVIASNPRGDGSSNSTRFSELYKTVYETINDAPITSIQCIEGIPTQVVVVKKKTLNG